MNIHPTAIVDKNAVIGEGTTIGPYTLIEGDVVIGRDCDIHQGVQVLGGSRIGDRCQIHAGSIMSSLPQDKKFKGDQTFLEIGDDCVIREYVTISRATTPGGKTVIGKNAYLMTSVHIGHDCKIGNGVTMANLVTLAGHVTIEDLVTIGGFTVIHQFVRIGEFAMVGGASGLMMDAPPYMITFGYPPARVFGVNVIGLKRNNIDLDTRLLLKRAFRILFRSNLNFSQAIDKINSEMPSNDKVRHLIEFFQNTKRGIAAASHSGHMTTFRGYNGFDLSNYKLLMEIVKDEEAARELLAMMEANPEEMTRIDY
jgi:UDP-N-acetylglucosamine acyltransferase